MGMFDYIKFEAPCPKCGNIMDDFQSKDGPCNLETLEPWQVDHFYASCNKCKAWVTGVVDADVEHIVKSCNVELNVK